LFKFFFVLLHFLSSSFYSYYTILGQGVTILLYHDIDTSKPIDNESSSVDTSKP